MPRVRVRVRVRDRVRVRVSVPPHVTITGIVTVPLYSYLRVPQL